MIQVVIAYVADHEAILVVRNSLKNILYQKAIGLLDNFFLNALRVTYNVLICIKLTQGTVLTVVRSALNQQIILVALEQSQLVF